MPELRVDDLETVGGRYISLFRLMAAIAWPAQGEADSKRREYLIVKSTTAAVAHPGDPTYEAAYDEFGGRPALLSARPLALFKKDFPRVMKHWLTGEAMFNLLYRLSATPSVVQNQSSVNKAAFILERRRESFCIEAKNHVPKHVSNIITTWGKIKPAAHLVAAAGTVTQNVIREQMFEDHRAINLWIQSLPTILGMARTLGRWGANHGHLDPDTMWQIPDNTDIPEVTLGAEALNARELDILQQYKATDRMS